MIVTFLPLFLRHLPTLPVVSGPQDMLSLCSKAELRLAMPPAQPLCTAAACSGSAWPHEQNMLSASLPCSLAMSECKNGD